MPAEQKVKVSMSHGLLGPLLNSFAPAYLLKNVFKNDSKLPKALIVSPATSQSSVPHICFKNFKHAQILKFRDSGI